MTHPNLHLDSARALGEWLKEGNLTLKVKWANKKRGWQVSFYQRQHIRLRCDSGGKPDLAPVLAYAIEQMEGLLRSDEAQEARQPRV